MPVAGGDGIRRHLTRRTSSGRFIPAVDGLRFVAIALVVLFHLDVYMRDRGVGLHGGTWLHAVLVRGDAGVLLFFGISGFVLGLPFARAAAGTAPPVDLRRYLVRRVTRIEPPYIVAMTIVLVAFVVVRHLPLADLLPHHLWSLAYLHNVRYDTLNPINAVVWSLEVEVQFYLLAPMLALLYQLRGTGLRATAFVGLALGAALVQLGPLQGAPWRVDLSLVGTLQYFLAGMLLADLVARRPACSANDGDRSHGARWADLAGMVGLVLILLGNSGRARTIVVPIGVTLCLVGALRGPRMAAVLSRPWIYVVGGMCYSIYLLHYPLISLVGARTIRLRAGDGYLPNLALQAGLLAIPLAVVCVGFFVLVERPCMDPGWPARVADVVRGRARRPLPPAGASKPSYPAPVAVPPSDHGAAQP